MKDFKKWEKEKELIPKMILIYCRNKHKKKRKSNLLKRNELCEDCKECQLFVRNCEPFFIFHIPAI